MPTYVRYVEVNESEGETWNFWLPAGDLDSEQVELLAAFVSDANPDQNEPTFELLGDEITEPEVDLLVRFADDGYYATHNKVVGRFTLSGDLDQMHEDDKFRFLYKGGIAKFFTTDTDLSCKNAVIEALSAGAADA